MLTYKRKIVIVLLTLLFIGVLFNFGYFWTNISFWFSPKKTADITVVTEEPVGKPNMLMVESLNISAPIVYTNGTTEKEYQEALVNGVVHYPGTAMVGELGNTYIFGHSSDFLWSKGKYKNVFALLPKIKIGAEIVVSNQEGKIFKYVVVESKKISTTDLSVLSQYNYEKKLLTLQTSYPVGTALARWVVIAENKK